MESQECIQNLVSNLLPRMEKQRWSIAELADRCDLSYNALYHILTLKTTDMKLSTLLKILDATEVPFDTIFEIPPQRHDTEQDILRVYHMAEQCCYILRKYSRKH